MSQYRAQVFCCFLHPAVMALTFVTPNGQLPMSLAKHQSHQMAMAVRSRSEASHFWNSEPWNLQHTKGCSFMFILV